MGMLSRLGIMRDRPTPDPFEALELQSRLQRLSCELRSLDSPTNTRFGSAHRIRAVQEAYERTLDDACRLAGATVDPGRGPAHRLLAETALAERGWTW